LPRPHGPFEGRPCWPPTCVLTPLLCTASWQRRAQLPLLPCLLAVLPLPVFFSHPCWVGGVFPPRQPEPPGRPVGCRQAGRLARPLCPRLPPPFVYLPAPLLLPISWRLAWLPSRSRFLRPSSFRHPIGAHRAHWLIIPFHAHAHTPAPTHTTRTCTLLLPLLTQHPAYRRHEPCVCHVLCASSFPGTSLPTRLPSLPQASKARLSFAYLLLCPLCFLGVSQPVPVPSLSSPTGPSQCCLCLSCSPDPCWHSFAHL